MPNPTIAERLAQAQQQSVQMYLRRQQIETQRQQLSMQAMQCDQELIALDGEVRVLTAISQERADG